MKPLLGIVLLMISSRWTCARADDLACRSVQTPWIGRWDRLELLPGSLRCGRCFRCSFGPAKHEFLIRATYIHVSLFWTWTTQRCRGFEGRCGARPGDSEAALGCFHIPGATHAPHTIYQLWIRIQASPVYSLATTKNEISSYRWFYTSRILETTSAIGRWLRIPLSCW